VIAIANSYGNVDVRLPVPKSYAHVSGFRLPQLCKKLGIRYARAMTGFVGKQKYGFSPQFDGVVVSKRSVEKLTQAIAAREQRNSGPAAAIRRQKAAENRLRKKQEQREMMCSLGVDPDGHTARRLKRGHIDQDHARLLGFIATHRHEHTDYEERLAEARGMGLRAEDVREYARGTKTATESARTWDEYLRVFGFDSPEAKALPPC